MTKARKGRSITVADEMLAGLQTFAHDLKALSAEEVKVKYRQRTVEVDFRPRVFGAEHVKQLRNSMDCSQKIFADFIGVSLGTLRNWEQGVRPVRGVAARLLGEMRIRPGYWRIRLRQSLKERKAG
ncbi:MAG: hypothetical protein NTY19_51870 [Planctomycetota bacterium]|nr:hypothetical protein [Planctomycetota bacterium]